MSKSSNRKLVLWSLFLFNAAVAFVVGIGGAHLHVDGHVLSEAQRYLTSAGMGVVALGAGAGLVLRREKPAGAHR